MKFYKSAFFSLLAFLFVPFISLGQTDSAEDSLKPMSQKCEEREKHILLVCECILPSKQQLTKATNRLLAEFLKSAVTDSDKHTEALGSAVTDSDKHTEALGSAVTDSNKHTEALGSAVTDSNKQEDKINPVVYVNGLGRSESEAEIRAWEICQEYDIEETAHLKDYLGGAWRVLKRCSRLADKIYITE